MNSVHQFEKMGLKKTKHVEIVVLVFVFNPVFTSGQSWKLLLNVHVHSTALKTMRLQWWMWVLHVLQYLPQKTLCSSINCCVSDGH